MGLPSYSDELRSEAREAFDARSDAREVWSGRDQPRIPAPARVPLEAFALPTKSGPVSVVQERELGLDDVEVDGSARQPGDADGSVAGATVEARGSIREPNLEARVPTDDEVDGHGSGREPTVDVRGMMREHKTPSMAPPLARFSRYDVLGRLAIGGMAVVYLGREAVEGGAQRHVAIKVLRRQGSEGDDAYFEELFLREGRTAAQLVHPNICHTYAFGKWGGHFFIALEWVDGVSLSQVMQTLANRGQALDPFIAASVAAQVAGALDYAHRARDTRRKPLAIVHRDVNPQNIMLRYDGVVKLLDFGVAQVAEPHADTRTDTVKGKFGYMAPEQLRRQRLDGRADVFALGVCLYEMLTGMRLYKRDSVRETVEAVLEEPMPALSLLGPTLRGELERILARALAKEPRARFESAGELQAALEGFLARSGEVVSARRLSALMDELYPEARREGMASALFRGPDVAARLAAIEAEGDHGGALAQGTRSLPAARLLAKRIVLLLVAVMTAAALSWAWPRDDARLAPAPLAPASARGGPAGEVPASARGSDVHGAGTAPPSGDVRAGGAARSPADARGLGTRGLPADTRARDARSAVANPRGVGSLPQAPAEIATPASSTLAAPPARAPAPAAPAAGLGPAVPAAALRPHAASEAKPEERLAKRRRKSPGFVADPGF